jgi:hypothetical protein
MLFSFGDGSLKRRLSLTRLPSLGTAPRENRADEQAMARKIDSIWDRFLDPTLATPGLLAKSRWRDHEHHRWGWHYHVQSTLTTSPCSAHRFLS